jgi:hypothetical protein
MLKLRWQTSTSGRDSRAVTPGSETAANENRFGLFFAGSSRLLQPSMITYKFTQEDGRTIQFVV